MVRFNKKKSGVRGIHTLVFGAKTRKSASSLRENCKSNVIGIDFRNSEFLCSSDQRR